MGSERIGQVAGLSIAGLACGVSSLVLTPAALAATDLAALGVQGQADQVELILTWQGEQPPRPQIRQLSDHRFALEFTQVRLQDPSAYRFPTPLPELGIRDLTWRQQGSIAQIQIETTFPLKTPIAPHLQINSSPASTTDASVHQVQIWLDLEVLSAAGETIQSSEMPSSASTVAIATEQAELESVLTQVRQAAWQPIENTQAHLSPGIDRSKPVPLMPQAQSAVSPAVTVETLSSSPVQPSSLGVPSDFNHSSDANPVLFNPKLSDPTLSFSTHQRGQLIAQSQPTALSDVATGFMSYVDDRTSAFTSELFKLEDRLRDLRWNSLQQHQPPPPAPPPEELVILTPSLTFEQEPSPPDLVDLYGSEPPPPQDLVDLYGPNASADPNSRSPQVPATRDSVAQIPDRRNPVQVEPPPPVEPAQPTPTVVNIPTSHTVGALSATRGIPSVSAANQYFTQLRSLNGAIGGILFGRTQQVGESNIAEITPEDPVPIQFRFADQGLGIDASVVDTTLLTTETIFPSTLFDYQLAGFGAYQGPIPGCTNPAVGPWTVVTPDSIQIDPDTGEEIFAPIQGDLLNPAVPSLGGASVDDICRQVSNEVVAEVLADPGNLINNPNALIFDIDNVEIVETETVLSRQSTTESTFIAIPHYWSYEQLDLVGETQTGSSSVLRQWFYDPRGSIGTALANLIAATLLPGLDPVDEVQGTPDQSVLALNEVTLAARDLLSGFTGRPNDEFRPAWSTYQILGDNADIPAGQITTFPVRGFGYEFGAIETSRLVRQDFSSFFTPTSDQETFIDVAVAGGGAGISVSNPEQGIDFFLSGDQPNTAVAVQVEVLRTLGFNTLTVEEEVEVTPGLAFNYGHTRLGETSQLVIRPSLQYSPDAGEVGLAFGGSFQAQLGDFSYILNGRYHTSDTFSYDGVISTLSLPVVNQPNSGWTVFTAQAVDTREDASSAILGTSLRVGQTTLRATYRPPLINDLTLTALSWLQSWSRSFSSELRFVDSSQGTGLSAEARQEFGRNRDLIVRASSFDGDTQGILGDLQGTEINSAEFSIEARF